MHVPITHINCLGIISPIAHICYTQKNCFRIICVIISGLIEHSPPNKCPFFRFLLLNISQWRFPKMSCSPKKCTIEGSVDRGPFKQSGLPDSDSSVLTCPFLEGKELWPLQFRRFLSKQSSESSFRFCPRGRVKLEERGTFEPLLTNAMAQVLPFLI